MKNLKSLKKAAQKEIKKAKNLKDLDEIFNKFLEKKGKVTQILRSLKELKKGKRARIGKEANLLKKFIEKNIAEKTQKLQKKSTTEVPRGEWFDITRPGKKILVGHLHPLTQVQVESEEIFSSMGFEIVQGPHIETEWYNFDALNIPKDHPARDLWDTLWLRSDQKSQISNSKSQKLLLRTHTSPVQIRYMEKHNPPLRIIVPGRVFRHEATDASHEFNFSQLEGLMVDKKISVANFKAVIQEFFSKFFGKSLRIKLVPDYFPFTEPSFQVSISCLNCKGKGCPACSRTGWMEMMGAGMVHPNVFKAAGLIPKDWQGFAFGIGLGRLTMMKYKIDDIRLFYSGDLRFLKQF